MDISSVVNTLMSSDAVKSIGKATNTDGKEVKNVLAAALPSLMNGAKAQSSDASTGFAEALLSHGKVDTSDIASFLGNADLKDGGKIISHLLGSNSASEIASIARSSSATEKNTSNILSAAAPLLMSLLGKESGASASDTSASSVGSIASSLLQNVDMGSILTGLLGSGSSSSSGKKKKSSLLGSIIGKIIKSK